MKRKRQTKPKYTKEDYLRFLEEAYKQPKPKDPKSEALIAQQIADRERYWAKHDYEKSFDYAFKNGLCETLILRPQLEQDKNITPEQIQQLRREINSSRINPNPV